MGELAEYFLNNPDRMSALVALLALGVSFVSILLGSITLWIPEKTQLQVPDAYREPTHRRL